MKHSKEFVSIVTAFLNASQFLEETIESVLAQTYTAWELLLVDDGSSDHSTEIAKRYAAAEPNRISYLEHHGHVNRGASASRNLGIARSRGGLIAFIDADDVWLPCKLEEQVACLTRHPEAGMVYGLPQYWCSWARAPRVGIDEVPRTAVGIGSVVHPPTLLYASYPLGRGGAPCPSDLMLRREVVERIRGFDPSWVGPFQLYEDQVFLAKVYLETPVVVADRTWLRYRQHPESCVTRVTTSGKYREVRLRFLQWLASYVRSGSSDSSWRIRWAVDSALWREQHPVSVKFIDGAFCWCRRYTDALRSWVVGA